MKELFISCIRDPECFCVNRLPAYSDHVCVDALGAPLAALSLDGEWEFAYFARPEDIDEALLQSGELPARIHVPGHMQLAGFGRPQYTNVAYPWDGREKLAPPAIPADNPVGLYVKRFTLDKLPEARAMLRLEGAEPACFVVLNGTFIGYAEDSFTPSAFDVTSALVPGENRLCVLVPRFASASWLEDQDFWRFSGLFRPVALHFETPVAIRSLSLVPTLDEALTSGRLQAAALVASQAAIDAVYTLSCGGISVEKPLHLSAGEQSAALTLDLPVPRLWSAEAPNLYPVSLRIRSIDGTFLAAAGAEIGFRRFELKDGLMLLNGKRIVFRGVNRHEWSATHGRALTPGEIETDIRLLKQNNFNAVRCSHYPNQSLFYALCDRYGLYVIDETNLETHGTWQLKAMGLPNQTPLPDDIPMWREAVLDRGLSMQTRDQNHACILIWSCGNESYGGKTLQALARQFRARDPHRLVHYEGLFNDRRYPDTSDIESRMYEKVKNIERYLKRKPKKPFMLCEYAHAMGNSFGNVDEYIALEDKYAQYQGGFIWDWIDQGLYDESGHIAAGGDFDDRPTDGVFCGDGLLFADRQPSPKLMEAKALYAPLRITCGEGGVTVGNRNLFVGTEAFRFVWRYLSGGKPVPGASGTFTLEVPPGESRRYPLPAPLGGRGELLLSCSAQLDRDTPYAHKGHEIAFHQCVIARAPAFRPDKTPAEVFTGMANIGLSMQNSHAIIDRKTGLLISVNNGRELLKAAVTPDFWRAPTDNDNGAMQPLRWRKWKLASLYRMSTPAFVHKKNRVTAFYRCGSVFYRIDCRGLLADTLELRLKLYPCPGDAPRVGFVFTLPGDFSQLRWYGNSAPEAAADRRSALRIGLNESTVSAQFVPYLNPQDCAGKTDVRWFTVSDGRGHTLELSADAPFEVSALPWTSHELEAAPRAHLLPPSDKTVLCASLARSGVGGDDSWGARVHKRYRVKTGKGLCFTLRLRLAPPSP